MLSRRVIDCCYFVERLAAVASLHFLDAPDWMCHFAVLFQNAAHWHGPQPDTLTPFSAVMPGERGSLTKSLSSVSKSPRAWPRCFHESQLRVGRWFDNRGTIVRLFSVVASCSDPFDFWLLALTYRHRPTQAAPSPTTLIPWTRHPFSTLSSHFPLSRFLQSLHSPSPPPWHPSRWTSSRSTRP